MDLKTCNICGVPQWNNILLKFGVNLFISFEVIGQDVICPNDLYDQDQDQLGSS